MHVESKAVSGSFFSKTFSPSWLKMFLLSWKSLALWLASRAPTLLLKVGAQIALFSF